MKILYGHHELSMDKTEYDIFLQSLQARVMSILGFGMTGIPLYTVKDYQTTNSVGFALLSTEDKAQIIGVAYKTSELSRVWCLTENDKNVLFVDGYPTIVEELGLVYDDSSKEVLCPALNGKVVIGNLE